MVHVTIGAKPEAVRQASAHVLFVEGSSPSAIDVRAVTALLADTRIRVEPLGPCFSIRSVAEALFPFHDTYYFLIDRDNVNDEDVNKSWARFPDPNTMNLIIWRKKEIENYFLDPDYLMRSQHVSVGRAAVEKAIVSAASRLLFRDVANSVIVELRDRQKSTWVKMFQTPAGFETKHDALKRLLTLPALKARPKAVAEELTEDALRSAFDAKLAALSDGRDPLEFGKGTWVECIRGKDVLPSVIQKCFKIKSVSGKRVQGDDAIRIVVTELSKLDAINLPKDFVELRELIQKRVQQDPARLST